MFVRKKHEGPTRTSCHQICPIPASILEETSCWPAAMVDDVGEPRFKPCQIHLEVAIPLLVERFKALHLVFHGVDIESFSREPGDSSNYTIRLYCSTNWLGMQQNLYLGHLLFWTVQGVWPDQGIHVDAEVTKNIAKDLSDNLHVQEQK